MSWFYDVDDKKDYYPSMPGSKGNAKLSELIILFASVRDGLIEE